jgi:hypothetical protein
MPLYIDGLDYQRDNFEVISQHEWRILGVAKAKKPIKFVRFCQPNCEAFQMDFDKQPICGYGCKEFVFDRHMIDANETIINLLFAVNTLDVHEGISIWIGEKYLKEKFGSHFVNKMLKQYNELMKTPEMEIQTNTEEEGS